jgi:hypothetical protein
LNGIKQLAEKVSMIYLLFSKQVIAGIFLADFPFQINRVIKHRTAGVATDYWVVKLDSKGNIQFDKTIGGNDTDNLTSLQQTSDGGYILGGGSFSNISGEKTENSKGVEDFWIVKLNRKEIFNLIKPIGGI